MTALACTFSSANVNNMSQSDNLSSFHFGQVAVVGKPNVGKSTLVNVMVGQKVSIVSDKPQTTRRSVMGIANGQNFQMCLVDTPGIHEAHNRLGREMLDSARAALGDVDVILYVADVSHHPGAGDQRVAKLLRQVAPDTPLVLALNKMDLLKADRVMPHVEAYCALFGVEAYMLTTATREINVEKLARLLIDLLPEGAARYPADEFTDQSARFMTAEIVRERILAATREEIPYATAVQITDWEEEEALVRIHSEILVEKASQRAILLGKGGHTIKEIGSAARKEIEALLGSQVFLELHVKVEEGWRMNPTILHELEYHGL
jgi:GTP-binding protein Era